MVNAATGFRSPRWSARSLSIMWCGVNGESVARDRERVRIAMSAAMLCHLVGGRTRVGDPPAPVRQGDLRTRLLCTQGECRLKIS